MTTLLPECMAPDGADPCAAFAVLLEKVESQKAENAKMWADFDALKAIVLSNERTKDIEIERLRAALSDAIGFMMNAQIDLATATKKKANTTLDMCIRNIKSALAIDQG